MKRVHQISRISAVVRATVAKINRNPATSKRAMTAAGRALGMRKKPYTETGINRVPCARCGEPSVHQWQICATGNKWCGVCEICDVALNALVIEFMKLPKYLTEHYMEKRKIATVAGKILRDPKSSKRAKSVAGAALTMASGA